MDTNLLIGLIGVGGTLAGILVTALSNYYLGERQETRKRAIEDWTKVVDEVYSPLIFELNSINDYGTLNTLRIMSKQIPALLKKYGKEEAVTLIPSLLALLRNDQNQMIEGILRKNARLIKPNALWFDLMHFWDDLKLIEKNLSWLSLAIVASKSSKDLGEIDIYIAQFQGYTRLGERLGEGATYLIDELTRMAQMEKPPTPSNYKVFYTEDVRKNLVKELASIPVFSSV